MEFSQIQELIKMVGRAKLTEFVLKEGDFKLIIRNQPTQESGVTAQPVVIPTAQPMVTMAPQAVPPAPPPPPKADAPAAAGAAADDASAANLLTIKSPMVGTFYRSASPEKPPFTKVGEMIEVGDTVCIIEAMKLFNEIESDLKGKVVKVLVEDASPVEYDQPLFLLEPA
ncbi:MAG: acetyl-CoA carboxylase biotin carboxyl carrier protein [Lewinellaceae bacterium]|nr:acetyl-CoA carboxylase biotin carboxyl carrier protein [Saprospiraceae bacterium]MCB9333758.1 acetyl-CoA carboxylase biotin carboxyl carrier protein [Lewinellaceae bacterium]